jgi:carboxymethylenebutenolidase
MPDIVIASGEQAVPAYLGIPAGDGPWPGVVVLHDALGQTDASRDQVDWLAASGYLAVAPDLFARGKRLLCLLAVSRQLVSRQGTAFDDIEAAQAWLVDRPDCTGRTGVIGFCMGGGFALLSATRKGFDVASVNYGPVPKDAEALLAGACPIVGSYGGRDRMMKGAARRLDDALQANGVDHDVRECPNAGHAFLEVHGGKLGWVMARLGMRFHGASATDARQRISAFFADHLEGPRP